MRSSAGYALVLALTVTTLLALAALELSRDIKISLALAANHQDQTRARLKALDGLAVAAQALLKDEPAFDGLGEAWADLEALTQSQLTTEGGAVVSLTDLSGRIDLNRLVDDQGRPVEDRVRLLERLLILIGRDTQLAAALLDWLDPDDTPQVGGAEAMTYAAAGLKYRPRNGPLLSLEELKLIKGFSPSVLRGDEEHAGLLDLVTIHAQTKINVNTAPKLVLQALSEDMTEAAAQAIIDQRTEQAFRSISELKNLSEINDDLFRAISPFLDVKSSWFEARITGRVGRARHKLNVVLRRTATEVSVYAAEVAP